MSDDRPDEQGKDGAGDADENVAGPPEEREEKGLGLTEEFARLEQEIQREVGGAPDPGDQEQAGDEHAAGEDDAAGEGDSAGEEPGDAGAPDFGETDSSEWVAPAPVGGDTEEWSQVEDEQADADADSTGDEGEPGPGEVDEAELPAGNRDRGSDRRSRPCRGASGRRADRDRAHRGPARTPAGADRRRLLRPAG